MKREAYCTLIDSAFLPQVLCLHASLQQTAAPFILYAVCLDPGSAKSLATLTLPNLAIIPVSDLETQRLLLVKGDRTTVEYCWTLTPFLFDRVFEIDPDAERVTYVDADLMFFSPPAGILGELERSGKDVLVTEHAYDPRYDQTSTSGRFCVQFVTFTRSTRAKQVRAWWQDRCVEWCYDRVEDGKFGDQKYLDAWPELFGDAVHVLARKELALAPWNVNIFGRTHGQQQPVFFHFHGLRLISPHLLRLWWGYRIGRGGRRFYDKYISLYRRSLERLAGISVEPQPSRAVRGAADLLRLLRNVLTGKTGFARV